MSGLGLTSFVILVVIGGLLALSIFVGLALVVRWWWQRRGGD